MVWIRQYGYSEAFTGVVVDEWGMWNKETLKHGRLLLSGSGSILLGFAQYIALGFVTDAHKLRIILLVLFPLIGLGCFYVAFFYTWRDEHRRKVEVETLLVKAMRQLIESSDAQE